MGAMQMLLVGKPASGPPPAVSVNPPESVTGSNTDFANSSSFTAAFSGGTPTSIVWSLEGVTNATASIIGGQGTSSVTVRLVTNDTGGEVSSGFCTIRCTAVIAGQTKSGIATKEHDFYYGGLVP